MSEEKYTGINKRTGKEVEIPVKAFEGIKVREVEFEVQYQQIDYDEFKQPVAYASIKAYSTAEAIKCLKSLIKGLEQIPHVANPIG